VAGRDRGRGNRDEELTGADFRSHDAWVAVFLDLVLIARKGEAHGYAAILIAQCQHADEPPATIRAILAGIVQDHAAVKEALTETWSNGQTEGHNTKLKLVKRQIYGRAGIDLLRARLLGAA
jgi:transposase